VDERLVDFAKSGEPHAAWLGAYVLLPDHLHAFVVVDDERLSLSEWAKSLKNAISKTLREQNVLAPHWEKGFFDHVLRSEDSDSAKWHYVRENPVRTGLVKHWQEWPLLGEIFDLEFRRNFP
jgi:putative transposase